MSWEDSYDRWKTTPPDPEESHLKCDRCGEEFYPTDKVYLLEGENLCKECALEWLEQFWYMATEEQCYG